MEFVETGFPGLMLVEPDLYEDARGSFFESYHARRYEEHGIPSGFVQDNQSHSRYGVVRGLHFQIPPFAQAKLVRVLRGTILDCVLDIRIGSPTYGKVFTCLLSAGNRKQLYVPPGFAHGFSVLSEEADVLYKCDAYYSREHERGFLSTDPALAIDWKVPADRILLSEKDRGLPPFSNYDGEFRYDR